MEPLVSPYVIYLIDNLNYIKGFFVLLGGIFLSAYAAHFFILLSNYKETSEDIMDSVRYTKSALERLLNRLDENDRASRADIKEAMYKANSLLVYVNLSVPLIILTILFGSIGLLLPEKETGYKMLVTNYITEQNVGTKEGRELRENVINVINGMVYSIKE